MIAVLINEAAYTHVDADGWDVDDDGRLYLHDEDGVTVAEYKFWTGVRSVDLETEDWGE